MIGDSLKSDIVPASLIYKNKNVYLFYSNLLYLIIYHNLLKRLIRLGYYFGEVKFI